jgi:uncharacterized protein DUF3800
MIRLPFAICASREADGSSARRRLRSKQVFLAYVDDSGDEKQQLLAALLLPLNSWTKALKVWLDWRRFLFRKWGIPADFELHAETFLRPRKDPIPDDHPRGERVRESKINDRLGIRQEIYRRSLETLTYMPGARVLTIREDGNDNFQPYGELLKRLHDVADEDGSGAIVMVDGFDSRLRKQHRQLKLADRLVIEDCWHEHSSHSQLLQIADFAVHAAYQHVAKRDSRRFMWDWYPQQLAPMRISLHQGCACGIATH